MTKLHCLMLTIIASGSIHRQFDKNGRTKNVPKGCKRPSDVIFCIHLLPDLTAKQQSAFNDTYENTFHCFSCMPYGTRVLF